MLSIFIQLSYLFSNENNQFIGEVTPVDNYTPTTDDRVHSIGRQKRYTINDIQDFINDYLVIALIDTRRFLQLFYDLCRFFTHETRIKFHFRFVFHSFHNVPQHQLHFIT